MQNVEQIGNVLKDLRATDGKLYVGKSGQLYIVNEEAGEKEILEVQVIAGELQVNQIEELDTYDLRSVSSVNATYGD